MPDSSSAQRSRWKYYGLNLLPWCLASLVPGMGFGPSPWRMERLSLEQAQPVGCRNGKTSPALVGASTLCAGIGIGNCSAPFCGRTHGPNRLEFHAARRLLRLGCLSFPITFLACDGDPVAALCLGILSGYIPVMAERGRGMAALPAIDNCMMIAGLVIEKRLNEGTPLDEKKWFAGWSRPFYLFLVLDIVFAQFGSLGGTFAGMWISLIHAVMIAVLASVWISASSAYISLVLGALASIRMARGRSLIHDELANSSGQVGGGLWCFRVWLHSPGTLVRSSGK